MTTPEIGNRERGAIKAGDTVLVYGVYVCEVVERDGLFFAKRKECGTEIGIFSAGNPNVVKILPCEKDRELPHFPLESLSHNQK